MGKNSRATGKKETNFFNKLARLNVENNIDYKKKEVIYMKNFPTLEEVKELGKKTNTRLISGESTPDYLKRWTGI